MTQLPPPRRRSRPTKEERRLAELRAARIQREAELTLKALCEIKFVREDLTTYDTWLAGVSDAPEGHEFSREYLARLEAREEAESV